MPDLGVTDLARALRELQHRFDLTHVSGAMELKDGHTITMRWSGDLLSLEREDGHAAMLDGEAIAREVG